MKGGGEDNYVSRWFRINEGGGSLINFWENSRMFRIDEGRSRICFREEEDSDISGEQGTSSRQFIDWNS